MSPRPRFQNRWLMKEMVMVGQSGQPLRVVSGNGHCMVGQSGRLNFESLLQSV